MSKFKVGDKVKHKDFGAGEIIGFDVNDKYCPYAVKFEKPNDSLNRLGGYGAPEVENNHGLWCSEEDLKLVKEELKNLMPEIAKMLSVEIGDKVKRFTKKLSNDKVVLGKIYEHYVDSFDVDIIYDYQSEKAKECGNEFYYGELIEKLAEYENLGTVEDFKELKERQIIVTRGRESGKLITEKALKYDLLQKELEVYKKALYNALKECKYIEIEDNVMPNFIEDARKELESERNII